MASIARASTRGVSRGVRYNLARLETENLEVRMHPLNRWALAMVAALALVPGIGNAQATPDLTGKWRLDRDKSDDAEALIRAGLGITEKTSGRPDANAIRTGDRLVKLSRALVWLEIRQSEKDFRLYDDAGNVRIYYIDEKKHSRETPWGAKLQTVTTLENGEIHMHTEGKDVGKVDEFYGLEGRQLVFVVRIRVKKAKDDVIVRSYYSRVQE
jgi:hypothetical protein